MLNSKAKYGSSIVSAGVLSWNNKRRHKASLGQKLFIISFSSANSGTILWLDYVFQIQYF